MSKEQDSTSTRLAATTVYRLLAKQLLGALETLFLACTVGTEAQRTEAEQAARKLIASAGPLLDDRVYPVIPDPHKGAWK